VRLGLEERKCLGDHKHDGGRKVVVQEYFNGDGFQEGIWMNSTYPGVWQ
jgi:hypothetical protein